MATMQAIRRNYRQSPRKVRLVADAVRGVPANRALVQLRVLNKRAASEIAKVIRSAIANAEHNNNASAEALFIKEIRVDEGLVLKRFIPRAFGRATPINKRTSHITVVLDEQVTEVAENTGADTEETSSSPSEAQTATS